MIHTKLDAEPFHKRNNFGHSQGGDAMLEVLNKEAKSWMSLLGVSTDYWYWLKICHTFDKLNNIHNAFQISVASKDDKGTQWSHTLHP